MADLTPEQRRVKERFPHGAIYDFLKYEWTPQMRRFAELGVDPNGTYQSLSDLLADPDFCRQYGAEHE